MHDIKLIKIKYETILSNTNELQQNPPYGHHNDKSNLIYNQTQYMPFKRIAIIRNNSNH